MNRYFNQFANVLWGKKSAKTSGKENRLKRPSRRRLSLESLEERALLAVTAGLESAAAAPASSTLVVTTLADTVNDTDNLLSLREAIDAAVEGDTITFASELSGGTILLAGTELTINKGITIDASSIDGMTIDANQQSRVFYVSGGTKTNPIQLISLTIQNGETESGGGIYNSGTLTLTNCTVSGNSASSYYFSANGGGIYNRDSSGTLNSYNSIIALNTASSSGSDIYRDSGTINGYNTLSSWTSWSSGSGNLEYDSSKPLFTDAENGDWTLAKNSQAIDKGNNDYVTTETDLAGKDRISGLAVDLGAYERQSLNVVGYEGLYDGQSHGVTVKGLEEGDKVSYSVNRTSFRDTPITSKDAGTHTIYVKVLRAEGEEWISSGDIIIKPIQLTISGTTVEDKEYDGTTTAKINVGQLSGYLEGDTLKAVPTGEFPSAEIGEYGVTVSYSVIGPTSRNYIAPESEEIVARIIGERLDTPKNICLTNDSYGLTMSWDAVENADKYYIYYGTSRAGVQENVIETTACSLILDELDPETQTYYFSVKAANTQGIYYESLLSDVKENFTFTFSSDTPAPGTLLTTQLSVTGAKVKYAWFRVSEDGEETLIKDFSDSYRFKLTNADIGYYIKCVVRGYKNGYEGISVTKTTLNPVCLPGTQIAAIKKNGADVTVAWYASEGADSYTLYYSKDASFSGSSSLSFSTSEFWTSEESGQVTVSETKVLLDQLDFGATYYLCVQAHDSTGAAPDSELSAVKAVMINKIATPEITGLSTVGDTLTVDWTLVEGANRYVIQYALASDFEGAKSKIVDSTETQSVTLTGLTAGEIYYVRVQARDKAGVFTSSDYSVRRAQVNKLESPSILTLDPSKTNLTIHWSAVANANRYAVYYADNIDFTGVRTKVVNNVDTVTITGLKAGATYYFKVQARDTTGNFKTSDDSEVRSAVIAEAALMPNVFDGNDEFDFIDDEFLAVFGEEPEVLDVF